jgi:hypothetical protein
MKVINKKIFEVTYVVPETPEEDEKIKTIIREITNEKVAPTEWKPVDNRHKKQTR